YAFQYAQKHGRKRVSIIHKANIMKLTDGLFMRTAKAVAAEYPDIECDTYIVDAACMHMVIRPERYDVLLTGNMYGDILSALAAGMVGGVAQPGIAIGDEAVIFESLQHRDSPEDSGPLALLNPAYHMLVHLGEKEAADRLWDALEGACADGDLADTKAIFSKLSARLQ
ncbi:MAG: NAD-dependent isocitrate dehydrogenase, partial [Myxococcales bacterium]|nr:NAD-dependent isocitrate dehydrogenase [Myxococcales bacterium]